jgi:hypothetical protein
MCSMHEAATWNRRSQSINEFVGAATDWLEVKGVRPAHLARLIGHLRVIGFLEDACEKLWA